MSAITIHFAADRQEADAASLARLLAADAAYDRGEAAGASEHVTFESLDMLLATLSPKRLALVRHLRGQPARSVRALAAAVGRDYRRVHEDVDMLTTAGLIVREGDQLTAPHERIEFAISLDRSAAA